MMLIIIIFIYKDIIIMFIYVGTSETVLVTPKTIKNVSNKSNIGCMNCCACLSMYLIKIHTLIKVITNRISYF